MPRKRLEPRQSKLITPEEEAVGEFQLELGGPEVFEQEITCPYCAYNGRVVEFRTKKSETSKQYSTKRFKCPDCAQTMLRDTLFKDMTVSEWARWMYFDVVKYEGGYNRISWEKLLSRLKQYGWAHEFWEAWRAAKEGREHSDVEDFLQYQRDYAQQKRQECPNWQQQIAGRDSMYCVPCPDWKVCWRIPE